jgi:hypothetical protein
MRVSAALSTILLFVLRPKTLRADNHKKMRLFAASRMRRRRGRKLLRLRAGPAVPVENLIRLASEGESRNVSIL